MERVLEITLCLNEREKEGTWSIYNLISGRLLFCYMQHAEDLVSFCTSLHNLLFKKSMSYIPGMTNHF